MVRRQAHSLPERPQVEPPLLPTHRQQGITHVHEYVARQSRRWLQVVPVVVRLAQSRVLSIAGAGAAAMMRRKKQESATEQDS